MGTRSREAITWQVRVHARTTGPSAEINFKMAKTDPVMVMCRRKKRRLGIQQRADWRRPDFTCAAIGRTPRIQKRGLARASGRASAGDAPEALDSESRKGFMIPA